MATTHCGQWSTANKIRQGARDEKQSNDNHQDIGGDTKGLLNEYPLEKEEKRNL